MFEGSNASTLERFQGFRDQNWRFWGFRAQDSKVPRFWDSRLPGLGVLVFQGLRFRGWVSRFQPFGGSRVVAFEGKNIPRLEV